MKRFNVLLASVVLAACAVDGQEKPAELTDVAQQASFERLWARPVGRVFALPVAGDRSRELRLGLAPASDGERLFIATHDGSVEAFELASGERLWKLDTRESRLWGSSQGTPFSAGPSVNDGRLVVGSLDGDVLALDATSGDQLWSQQVTGELLAPPLLVGGSVILRSTDGRVLALDARTGEQRWETAREVPPLTIRGASAAATDGQRIFAGFDNGKVAALSLEDGAMLWEATIANPGGLTELSAIVDVDGDLEQFGNELYATAFNGNLAALAVESGEVLWRQEMSSVLGPEVAWGNVFVADASSVLSAFDRLSGTSAWTQDALRARRVSPPAVFGDLLVVGDFEGYLHFVGLEDGELRARVRHFGSPVRAKPLVVGDYMVVLSDDNRLAVYRRSDSDSE